MDLIVLAARPEGGPIHSFVSPGITASDHTNSIMSSVEAVFADIIQVRREIFENKKAALARGAAAPDAINRSTTEVAANVPSNGIREALDKCDELVRAIVNRHLGVSTGGRTKYTWATLQADFKSGLSLASAAFDAMQLKIADTVEFDADVCVESSAESAASMEGGTIAPAANRC